MTHRTTGGGRGVKGVVSPAPGEGAADSSESGPSISLCEVVAAEMMAGRNPERPIVSRMALIGAIVSKDEPPKQFMEECIHAACATVNAEDPFGGKTSAGAGEPASVTGIFVEMAAQFFAVLEGEPEHLQQTLLELRSRLAGSAGKPAHDGLRNIQVALYTDDVVARTCPRWLALEATLPASSAVNTTRLEECVVDAVHGLMAIGKQCATLSRVQMDTFLQSARTTHAQFIPRSNLVDKLLEANCCPTLDEFATLVTELPVVRRPTEVVYPLEPPVSY